MDAGIIRNFKLKYKAQFLQWLLDIVTAGTGDKMLDVLSAIRMVVKSWAEVRPETIRHCWIHTGIVSGVMAAVLRKQDEPTTIWSVTETWKNGNQTPMQLPPPSQFRVMTTATETKTPYSLIATR
uniref:DDE-1 domain-containing protein n=1 Tax=Peronospora matthiolae TaxID=2874970 RepID=A0AAV1VPD6_9STRA